MQRNPSSVQELPPPWADFLREIDRLVFKPIELHGLGGFVITACYGLPRPTADLDYLSIRPPDELSHVEEIAGQRVCARK